MHEPRSRHLAEEELLPSGGTGGHGTRAGWRSPLHPVAPAWSFWRWWVLGLNSVLSRGLSLLHLGRRLRSSQEAGAGQKPEAVRLRGLPSCPSQVLPPPAVPAGNRAQSPGPALKTPSPSDPASNCCLPGFYLAPLFPLRPLRAFLGANDAPLAKTFFTECAPLGNSVRPFKWARPLRSSPRLPPRGHAHSLPGLFPCTAC